jgi:hypothetical protein
MRPAAGVIGQQVHRFAKDSAVRRATAGEASAMWPLSRLSWVRGMGLTLSPFPCLPNRWLERCTVRAFLQRWPRGGQ